jgi:hypothetical protein
LHFVDMKHALKRLALLACTLALVAGVLIYFVAVSDNGRADRNVPGATTGPGQATLRD